MRHHLSPRRLALGIVCLAVLAGCGSPDTVDPGTSPSPKSSATPEATVQVSDMVVTGTVEQGVETGCLLLQGFLLVGGPANHTFRAGETVKVTGRVNPDLVTTCQQGVPLEVTAVEPA